MKVTLDITTKDTKGMDEFTTSFIKEIVEHELENEAAKIIEDIRFIKRRISKKL